MNKWLWISEKLPDGEFFKFIEMPIQFV